MLSIEACKSIINTQSERYDEFNRHLENTITLLELKERTKEELESLINDADPFITFRIVRELERRDK